MVVGVSVLIDIPFDCVFESLCDAVHCAVIVVKETPTGSFGSQ